MCTEQKIIDRMYVRQLHGLYASSTNTDEFCHDKP